MYSIKQQKQILKQQFCDRQQIHRLNNNNNIQYNNSSSTSNDNKNQQQQSEVDTWNLIFIAFIGIPPVFLLYCFD